MDTTAQPAASGLLRRLGALHDAVTAAGFAASALCPAVIAAAFCYEVVSRYAFNAPTEFATPVVTYALLAMIFLAMPDLTRRAAHVAINILVDRLGGARARLLRRVISAVAAAACLIAAWITFDATAEQFAQGIWTNPPFAVPKWSLSVLIPYGMLSAGVHFLRELGRDGAAAAVDGSLR